MSDTLLNFFIAGFNKSLEELKIQNQQENLKTRELIMAIFDKLNELSGKNDALVAAIATEKAEVTASVDALKSEVEALKTSISDLQGKLDASNAETSAISDAIDTQIAKVDAAIAGVSEIIA